MKVCPRKEKGYPRMDEIPLFPIWFPDLLFRDVLSHAVEYISRVCRLKGSEHCCHFAVDVQTSVALGISRNSFFGRRSTVCVRFLQCDAHLHGARFCHHAFVQAAFMVRLLSDGHHDTAHMQGSQWICRASLLALHYYKILKHLKR